MSLSDHLSNNAHYVTYAGATGAVTVWGLHVSELAVMVSSLAAVCGALIQVLSYLDRRRSDRQRGVTETETDGTTD